MKQDDKTDGAAEPVGMSANEFRVAAADWLHEFSRAPYCVHSAESPCRRCKPRNHRTYRRGMYGTKRVTPYLHILGVHVAEMLERHGQIRQFSCEAQESLNYHQKKRFQNNTCLRGTSMNPNLRASRLLNKELRVQVLPMDVDAHSEQKMYSVGQQPNESDEDDSSDFASDQEDEPEYREVELIYDSDVQ